MDKSITINDVKKKKIELESDILKLVKGFEKECGVYLTSIYFDRKHDVKDTVPESAYSQASEKGPIENVTANMELDLMY